MSLDCRISPVNRVLVSTTTQEILLEPKVIYELKNMSAVVDIYASTDGSDPVASIVDLVGQFWISDVGVMHGSSVPLVGVSSLKIKTASSSGVLVIAQSGTEK